MEYNPKDPRNLLASLLNSHLPESIQIPQISREEREDYFNNLPETATLGMGMGGIGKQVVKSIENQKALYDFNKLKKAIQDRGYGKQLTDDELLKTYNKQVSPEQLAYAEKLRRSDVLQNAFEKNNADLNSMPNPMANEITKLLKAN